jgi:hypothetical protein
VDDRWETGRIEAFSDGVFAIAITLLVLDIDVPSSAFDDLRGALADEWPSYLAFASSFFTIGALWLLHHGVLRRLRWADGRVIRINRLPPPGDSGPALLPRHDRARDRRAAGSGNRPSERRRAGGPSGPAATGAHVVRGRRRPPGGAGAARRPPQRKATQES